MIIITIKIIVNHDSCDKSAFYFSSLSILLFILKTKNMKNILFFISVLAISVGNAQSLPIDFEAAITTANFVDFDGGTAAVIANPQVKGINTSAKVGQIVRNGGAIWAGSKITLAKALDFKTLNGISMKVFTTAPVGTIVKFKLEGKGSTEKDTKTTVSNAWETLKWDFTGKPADFTDIVFMFDFGKTGDGSVNSTFLFDEVQQFSGGGQIDLPVDFESATLNYTMTDFGGNSSSLVKDPTNPNNKVIEVIKTGQAETWAGTTIGTSGGFVSNIPLTLTNSKMNIRVWSPKSGTPIRLKVEDSKDPTHTCETEIKTTVSGAWETMVFDFKNQAPGTEALSVGLSKGFTYNMASIFFNFGATGASAGAKTYYFDDVKFGNASVGTTEIAASEFNIFPNPSNDQWTIFSKNENITQVEIFDLRGKLMLKFEQNNNFVTINASNFPIGIYFSKISTDSGRGIIKLLKH